MKLIFLDIDGVLNNHIGHPTTLYNTIDKERVVLFNKLLVDTDSYFVLSSAWRYMVHGGSMNLEGLRNLLYSHWLLAGRLIDITRPDRDFDTRGEQIKDFLNECKVIIEKYVILDDLDLGISTYYSDNFVRTNGSIGLTEADIEKAKQILS